MDGPKRSYFLSICILVAVALLSVALWQQSEMERYQITTGFQEMHLPFRCDTKTAKVWRY